MTTKKIAFAGASGTGKTVLAQYIESELQAPFNPIGSRNVAKMMGYANPYEVDAAGKRAEFQQRLITEKLEWERGTERFVTDRTPCDNLAYTSLHDVRCIDSAMLAQVAEGMGQYTHVIFCRMSGFFSLNGDPVRVAERSYHEVFEVLLDGLLDRYRGPHTKFFNLYVGGLEERKRLVRHFVQ
jgi:hypothetical protein